MLKNQKKIRKKQKLENEIKNNFRVKQKKKICNFLKSSCEKILRKILYLSYKTDEAIQLGDTICGNTSPLPITTRGPFARIDFKTGKSSGTAKATAKKDC